MLNKQIQIGDRYIGLEDPCFIIGEAGVNHNGDIQLAYQLIDAAAEAGVDAVKFQTFSAEKLVTPQARQAAYQSQNTGINESQYEMLKRLELSYEDFAKLKAYTEKKGLIFMSSPFDEEAIDFLHDIGVSAFKAGSGELTNLPYLQHMASKGLPLIISTGMATMAEVLEAVETIRNVPNDQLILLHCTSNYPAPVKDANLRAMLTMGQETSCIIGYSDHTEGIRVPVLAVAMGAKIIEKHFTLNKALPGPDHKASLEPSEMKVMVDEIRLTEQIRGKAEKIPTEAERKVAEVARKSLVASRDISAGSVLEKDHILAKRPGTGISPASLTALLGKKIKYAIQKDQLFSWDMIE